jgi:hypothetical protein
MVNELIVAFLGTLPLDPFPESKPFTPLSAGVAPPQGNAWADSDHPGRGTKPGRRGWRAGQSPDDVGLLTV